MTLSSLQPAPSAALPVPTFDRVPFEDTDILACRAGDVIYVPVKSFCVTIGLPCRISIVMGLPIPSTR